MAVIKKKDLKQMSDEELNEKILELRKELIKENAQIATGTTPKNPGNVRLMKKTIARIKTIMKMKKKEEA